jgi:hypothetical protein
MPFLLNNNSYNQSPITALALCTGFNKYSIIWYIVYTEDTTLKMGKFQK